jgi:glycosyltransferase involved in cell wall biosynthesis
MESCRFSIIVPAYNAAVTLDETLASIQAQTFPHWEAVIVDDGSTDNTAAIAAHWTQADHRFRLLRQANGGESAARNSGVREARHEWLLFVDADDWIAPTYLERMAQQIIANPRLDAVVCGCVRVTPSGEFGPPGIYEPAFLENLFPEFVRDCPFAIHNAVVRRSLVAAIGEFDTGLVTGADWDFWQRVTRTGARFGLVSEALAFYRMRPGSASSNAERVLLDGQTVIRRGYAHDPRVSNPDPNYVNGLPPVDLPEMLFYHALWPASLLLGQGKDARPLLQLMGELQAPYLDPVKVAACLFEYIPLAASGTSQDWLTLWPVVEERLKAYLAALEKKAEAAELAYRTPRYLEWLILETMNLKQPQTIGLSYGLRINVDDPISEVAVPLEARQLVGVVETKGHYIGTVQIPVSNRAIAGQTIGEAIMTELAWPLMLWRFRINIPSDSPLRLELYRLIQRRRLLTIIPGLMRLAWPLFCWQFRDGLLREPQLLARLLWRMLKMRPLSFALQLIRASYESPPSRVKEILTAMAQRLVHEEGLLIITTST